MLITLLCIIFLSRVKIESTYIAAVLLLHCYRPTFFNDRSLIENTHCTVITLLYLIVLSMVWIDSAVITLLLFFSTGFRLCVLVL